MAVENNSTVRWFHSEMPGAPQVTGTTGEIISILDACLVNGFGTVAPDGNKITISGGVATVEFSGGNDFEKYAVIEIAGATPVELNDVWRVTGATTTTFTFDCPGIPDGNAAGSITVKRATPGYWEKTFGDTLKAAYRSTHPDATGFFLRVDSDNNYHASVRGYEAMTGIDQGTEPFPSNSEAANMRWATTMTTSASYGTPAWFVIADERWLWFLSYFDVYGDRGVSPYRFGDFLNIADIDIHSCAITAQASSNPSRPYYNTTQFYVGWANPDGCWIARRAGGVTSESAPYTDIGGLSDNYLGRELMASPSVVTGGMVFTGPMCLTEKPSGLLRGVTPGLYSGEGAASDIFDSTEKIGRHFLVVPPSTGVGRALVAASVCVDSTFNCLIGIDIEGPWR